MSSSVVGWSGRCPDPKLRARLVGHLQRLAALSAFYVTGAAPEQRTVRGQLQSPAAIEQVSRILSGRILIASGVAKDPGMFATAARGSALPPAEQQESGSPSTIVLEDARLSGIDFALFSPGDTDMTAHRLSFVFLETTAAPFLNGSLVQLGGGDEGCGREFDTVGRDSLCLGAPHIELPSYLEDWIDLLLSWVKYFFVGDLAWRHGDEMQGYEDYRKVFSDLHQGLGTERAEKATFDAILATFAQHADYGSGKFAAASGDR